MGSDSHTIYEECKASLAEVKYRIEEEEEEAEEAERHEDEVPLDGNMLEKLTAMKASITAVLDEQIAMKRDREEDEEEEAPSKKRRGEEEDDAALVEEFSRPYKVATVSPGPNASFRYCFIKKMGEQMVRVKGGEVLNFDRYNNKATSSPVWTPREWVREKMVVDRYFIEIAGKVPKNAVGCCIVDDAMCYCPNKDAKRVHRKFTLTGNDRTVVRDNGNFLIDLFPYGAQGSLCGKHCRQIPVRGIVFANSAPGYTSDFVEEANLDAYLNSVYTMGMAKRQRELSF